ncbi:MAG TPA: NAD(P)H-binding protein [Luteitalea sp.]|nr:NAD(P)H-binding protein [Luteitalea sp.]
MISVMGATGHIGRKVTEALLEAGQPVRALGRSESKLAGLAAGGAEIRPGDAADAAYLTDAFRGADAVLVLLPSNFQAADYRAAQNELSAAIAAAIRDSAVRSVVAISSLGAELADGTGPIATLHDFERHLTQLEGVDVLILRPAYFFENFEESLGLIRSQGIHANGNAPDIPVPMIATRDIAAVAADALRTRNWHGVEVRELHGPRDLTFAEATRILGARLGIPDLPYVRVSYDDLEATYRDIGFSPDVARTYVEMVKALDVGLIRSKSNQQGAVAMPTRFEEFVDVLADQFRRV